MKNPTFQETKYYIQHKHLYLNESQNEAVFLGYKLDTTNMEYLILKTLAINSKKPLSLEKICELSDQSFTKSTLSYHVSNINKKAKAIGGRPLIKNITKIGYFLNEEM